nr:hypothetical protein [Cylindrotheca closterium]ULD16257.1 hypothetical protein [Cylindrotheca closterium]
MLLEKKYKFNIQDIKEITVQAYYVFVGEFKLDSNPVSDTSDSDLPDFDPDEFGCGEINSEIESFIETNWKECDPLDGIYGPTTATVIKETVRTVKEDSQCAGIKIFDHIIKGEDQNLIGTCTNVCYWCCCEALKKTSPIIAEASINLMY